MRLQAALVGNLEEVMQGEIDKAAGAITLGTSLATNNLKLKLRQMTLAAFGSPRFANSWQGNAYPKPPNNSMGAAGMVVSKAPHIIEAFSQATTIRSKDGFWLAIPSPDAPKGSRFQRVTPSNWPEGRYGKLRFVYRRGKSALLVVDGVKRSASGRVSRQLKGEGRKDDGSYRKGASSVVMFFLVPFVRTRKVFDLDATYAAALDDMIGNIIRAWGE